MVLDKRNFLSEKAETVQYRLLNASSSTSKMFLKA